MALSYAKYTGTGTTTQFPITFPYIDASHIFVSVNGIDVAFTSDVINQVVTLPSAPVLGSDIRVYRFTPRNKTYSDFSRGNALGQRNMNNSFLWQLYISQEIAEGSISPEFVVNQDLNMGGYKIVNLGKGVDDQDAVTIKQLNDALINVSAQGVVPIVGARQIGVAGQSQYNTPATSAASPASFRISIDGLLQRPVTDYNTDTIGKVDFVGAVPVGADIDVVFFEPNNLNTDASDLLVTSTGTSTPRKLSDRFSDALSVKDFGAVGGGIINDTTAINAATTSGNVTEPDSNYLVTEINVKNDISGGTFTRNDTSAGQAITIDNDGVHLNKVKVNSEYHGVQVTQPIDDSILSFCDIQAKRFAVLYNDSSSGSNNLRFLFNNLRSNESDALEINIPSEQTKNVLTLGNTLSGGLSGSDSSSGFSVGIAGVKNHITAFNYSEGSRRDAYHVEDLQTRGVNVGNIWDNCKENGMVIIPQYASDLPNKSDGVISIGNHVHWNNIDKTGTKGLWYTYQTPQNGSLNNCIGIANYIKGFDTGIELGVNEFSYHSGNVTSSCDTSLATAPRSVMIGDNISDNCATLVKQAYGSIIGGSHSKTEPTEILTSGTSNQIGSVLKRFSFKTTKSIQNAANIEYPLFNAPSLMKGTLTVLLNNTTNNIFYSSTVVFDGSSVTESDSIKDVNGNIFATVSFTYANGKINFKMGSAVAISNATFTVDFDGIYYK